MKEITTHNGSCFCGSVQFELRGAPAVMGYCHCDSCREWSAGPVNAFTLWKPANIEIIAGREYIASFSKTPRSNRQWCRNCGGHLFIEHPDMGLTDVAVAVIEDLTFDPVFHVNYQESVLRIHDGITKFKDMPTDAGGSGVELTE